MDKELAVVFVHPFWLVRNCPEEKQLQKKQRTNKLYGSYSKYSENLKLAYNLIKQAELRSVFILPFYKKDSELKPVDGNNFLSPLESSIIFDCSFNKEGEINKVSLDGCAYYPEKRLKDVSEIVDILYDEGLRRTIVCGELGPWEKNSLGCVGTFAKYLETKMDVKGLEGCIFPLRPYERHYLRILNFLSREMKAFVGLLNFSEIRRELRKLTHTLYEETVKIEELVALSG